MLKFQEASLSPNFAKLESWTKYVKNNVGPYSDLKDLTLEDSAKFKGIPPIGCYVYRFSNHQSQEYGMIESLIS